MYAIQVSDLNKTYKNGKQALNNLCLTVERGTIFSLLGENGAGKSTLLHILTTFMKPTSGNVFVLEKDIEKNAKSIRTDIACVAQQISIDTHLSLLDNMMFQSQLYKIPKNIAKQRALNYINLFDLEPYLKYHVSSYSGGIKRRLDMALNMIIEPKILFLDEPTVGMDIQSRIKMWEMILKIRNDFGTTIFLTTHYLEEAEHLSDVICIMKEGKDIIQGSPSKLKKCIPQETIQIRFVSSEKAEEVFSILLHQFPHAQTTLKENDIIINSTNSSADLVQFTEFMLKKEFDFIGINIVPPTIENIFLLLTQHKTMNAILG